MPFPGLDHGNGLLLAMRRRLPLFQSTGWGSPQRGIYVTRGVAAARGIGATGGACAALPGRLELDPDPMLDGALTLVVDRVLNGAACELDQAVSALRGLDGARSLRALLLPSAAYGASRLLIQWARKRNLRVGAFQHGIYAFREFDGADRRADVIFGWGEGTVEQVSAWPEPRPRVTPVGVPGLRAPEPPARRDRAGVSLRRALIAAADTVETPIGPVGYCEAFIAALVPGIERLARAGVEIVLRPHPGEQPERYRQLLRVHGLDVRVAAEGAFQAALAGADILISSASSVAFEAAAQGAPVLLWLGTAPLWVRREHLVDPWTQNIPGMFQTGEDLASLIEDLLERPAEGFRVAHELGDRLARYAAPFDAARFALALRALGS
jgi:hypothetical protein